MKNATQYEKEIRKLLAGMKKTKASFENVSPLQVLIEGVLQADSSPKSAARAYASLQKEYVDFNELRVSPIKDLVDIIGRDYPGARRKAEMLVKALNRVFDRTYALSMDYMAKMPKRDLARHLLEDLGLNHYAAAVVILAFGGHAVPVDTALVESLELEKLIPEGASVTDVQGLLERITPQKDDFAAHELLRAYVEKSSKALAKKHKLEAAARAQAQALADAEAAEKAAREAAKAREAQAKALDAMKQDKAKKKHAAKTKK